MCDTHRQASKLFGLLNKVNLDLRLQFGTKHTHIEASEIEAVYFRNVLSVQADAKTRKGTGKGYLTGIMYFAPASLSGVNVCPKSSAGCRAACLFSAGRGRFYSVTRARIVKTLAYHADPIRFTATIKKSIKTLLVKAKNKGLTPVVRLNGTSDILWERNTDIIQSFPNVQFYDYTKISKRFAFSIPSNYHLTFSVSESNSVDAQAVLAKGFNVAAVFRKDIPAKLWGFKTVNGDETDLRFLDRRGVVVGLKAKGKAKRDTSGFVIDPPQAARKAA
jgi:hypothetical protein